MNAATPEDLANGIKLLERLRTGELNLIPAMGIPSKQDASTAMLQRVEDVLRAAYTRVAEPVGDGGPAFPEPGLSGLPNGEFIHARAGMTLRDYAAIHATGLEEIGTATAYALMGRPAPVSVPTSDATPEFWLANATYWAEAEARLRYLKADAMIKARLV